MASCEKGGGWAGQEESPGFAKIPVIVLFFFCFFFAKIYVIVLFPFSNKYLVIALCQEKERQIKLTQMAQEFHKHLTVKQYGFRLSKI